MHRIGLCVAIAVAAFAAQAQTGVLVVEATPRVVAVHVDSVLAGTTPLTREVAAGERRLTVSRVGYAPYEARIVVPAGDTLVVRTELSRLAGTLSVQGLPAGARVFVRDTLYAGGPVSTGQVPLTVEVPGVRTVQRYVAVYPAESTVVEVEYASRAFDLHVPLTALVAPGLAQVRGGRPIVGALYAAAVAGTFAVTGSALITAASASSDRRAAYAEYLSAEGRDDAFLQWIEVEATVERERRALRRIGPAVGFLVAAHALGLADTVLRHSFSPRLRVNDRGVALAVPIR